MLTLADVLKTNPDALLKIGDGTFGLYYDSTENEFVVYRRTTPRSRWRRILICTADESEAATVLLENLPTEAAQTA